jgi:hypothetical protein
MYLHFSPKAGSLATLASSCGSEHGCLCLLLVVISELYFTRLSPKNTDFEPSLLDIYIYIYIYIYIFIPAVERFPTCTFPGHLYIQPVKCTCTETESYCDECYPKSSISNGIGLIIQHLARTLEHIFHQCVAKPSPSTSSATCATAADKILGLGA